VSERETRNARRRTLCTPYICSNCANRKQRTVQPYPTPSDEEAVPALPTYIHKPQMSHSQSLTRPPEQANSLTAVFDPLRQPDHPSQPCALPRLPLLLFFWCVFLTTRQSMMSNCSPCPFRPQCPKYINTHRHTKTVLLRCVYCLTKQLDEIQTVLTSQRVLKNLTPVSNATLPRWIQNRLPAAHTPRCVILLHMQQ
jgi:hypothetical protein